jgi:hypothetical protein
MFWQPAGPAERKLPNRQSISRACLRMRGLPFGRWQSRNNPHEREVAYGEKSAGSRTWPPGVYLCSRSHPLFKWAVDRCRRLTFSHSIAAPTSSSHPGPCSATGDGEAACGANPIGVQVTCVSGPFGGMVGTRQPFPNRTSDPRSGLRGCSSALDQRNPVQPARLRQ